MKLGLKVNADKDSIERLDGANPPFVEVWFNVNAKDSYNELFAELNKRNCEAGLHFWGLLEDDIGPNLAYPDQSVITQTLDLMRTAIDTAVQHKLSYVNIHPGASALSKVNYDKERFDAITEPISTDTSIELFLENSAIVSTYARSRGVVFTVETVPMRITDGWYDVNARHAPKNIYELPITAIEKAAESGMYVANDFCHTAANIISDDPVDVWNFLKQTTIRLADQTRLIHLGFTMPPFNGTDNHDELDNPILESRNAVPNKKQMIELLKLFQNRDDIWMLVEPKDHHVKNFLLAQNILNQSYLN